LAVVFDLSLERTRRGREHERERHSAVCDRDVLDHAEADQVPVEIRILDLAERLEHAVRRDVGHDAFRSWRLAELAVLGLVRAAPSAARRTSAARMLFGHDLPNARDLRTDPAVDPVAKCGGSAATSRARALEPQGHYTVLGDIEQLDVTTVGLKRRAPLFDDLEHLVAHPTSVRSSGL